MENYMEKYMEKYIDGRDRVLGVPDRPQEKATNRTTWLWRLTSRTFRIPTVPRYSRIFRIPTVSPISKSRHLPVSRNRGRL